MNHSPGTIKSARRTHASRPRPWAILGGSRVVAAAVIVLALFQPWKLWVDDRVDEAAPVGAVQIPAGCRGY